MYDMGLAASISNLKLLSSSVRYVELVGEGCLMY